MILARMSSPLTIRCKPRASGDDPDGSWGASHRLL